MADTQRTQAALAALLADNSSGDISPQDLRDFLESCHPTHGSLHFTDPGSPTTIAVPSTFYKVSNTADFTGHRLSMPSTGRLRYDGPATSHCRLTFAGSISSASSNQVIRLAIAQNGVVLVPSIMKTKLGGAGDVQAISLIVDTTIALNDYFELFVSNDTAANTVTVEHGYLSALAFLS